MCFDLGLLIRQKYPRSKTHLLLQILASISTYDPLRMIVMTVVTKIGGYNVQGISDRLLGYHPLVGIGLQIEPEWKRKQSLREDG